MHDIHRITKSDKVLATTFLKLLPDSVTPNQLTIFRFFTVPFVVFLIFFEYYEVGIVLFVISAFTDALDGALARTKKRITEWGTLYDPVADKFLIGLTALVIIPKFLNPIIVFLIILLEVILIGSAYYRSNRGAPPIPANAWGKTKMIFQSVGVGLLLLISIISLPYVVTIAGIILYISIALGLVSLISYGV